MSVSMGGPMCNASVDFAALVLVTIADAAMWNQILLRKKKLIVVKQTEVECRGSKKQKNERLLIIIPDRYAYRTHMNKPL